jgi:hypothetical protein
VGPALFRFRSGHGATEKLEYRMNATDPNLGASPRTGKTVAVSRLERQASRTRFAVRRRDARGGPRHASVDGVCQIDHARHGGGQIEAHHRCRRCGYAAHYVYAIGAAPKKGEPLNGGWPTVTPAGEAKFFDQ